MSLTLRSDLFFHPISILNTWICDDLQQLIYAYEFFIAIAFFYVVHCKFFVTTLFFFNSTEDLEVAKWQMWWKWLMEKIITYLSQLNFKFMRIKMQYN